MRTRWSPCALDVEPGASLELTNSIVQGFNTGGAGGATGQANNFWDVPTDGAASSLIATYHLDD